MTASGGGEFETLDQLLRESVAPWTRWRAEHSEPLADSDEYVAVVGELVETLLPVSDETLHGLAVDPRIWTHDHVVDEHTVRESVQAALRSLMLEHLSALAGGDAR